jgi:hypothetical protein
MIRYRQVNRDTRLDERWGDERLFSAKRQGQSTSQTEARSMIHPARFMMGGGDMLAA